MTGYHFCKITTILKEPIYTDNKYASVKLHFVWDENQDQMNLLQSPWVRVMQPVTGKKTGMQFIPRVGQEVICQFENGRLEQPIVIAAMHNSRHLPCFKGSMKTAVGWQTHTIGSDDPERGHRVIFDDKKNAEKLLIHSSGDMLETVAGNKTTVVQGD